MLHRYLLVTLAVLGACSADMAPLTAENIELPAPVPGVSMGAGYLTLDNNSGQDIVITDVKSPQLDSVKMHETVLEDGVSRMRGLPQVTIAANQSVVFERGAKHLMLRYPDERPRQLTLQFFAGDALLLSVDVSLEE
jgi:copper(I)-binding protein